MTEEIEAIKSILKTKSPIYSVTRINRDNLNNDYLNTLTKILRTEKIPFESYEFLQRAVACHEWISPPHIYIIGGKERIDVEKNTDRLVSLVTQCPDGPILKSIREEISGGQIDPDYRKRIEKEIRESKKKHEKFLKIGHGPIFYNPKQLKDIMNLFAVPFLNNNHDSRSDD